MDESRHLLAFSDCVWDFNVGAARPIQPEDYCSLSTGYAFPARPPEHVVDDVRDFIRGLFETTERIRTTDELSPLSAYFLRHIADKLNGNRRFQEFYLWTGLGGNGKGLVRNLIAGAFGNYLQGITHQVLTKTQEKQNSHSPEMCLAKGKRMLIATEPDAEDKLQVSIVKQYSGGDLIVARAPYGTKSVEYTGQFGLVIQCNNKPRLSKADGGIQRRLRIINFPFQFKDEDHIDLTNPAHKPSDSGVEEDTLRNTGWRDAFLHLLLETYTTITSAGLRPPPEVLEASAEFMDESNPVKGWLLENFRVGLDKEDERFRIGASEINALWAEHHPGKRLADSAMKNYLEVGCGLAQIKAKHPKTLVRWDGGAWRDTECRAGKYWIGLCAIEAPHPDGKDWE
jgi:phage/plasmid-associated DNA primase